jgi:hypothetical protein
MHPTDANTDCLNCPTSVDGYFAETNTIYEILGAIGTDASGNRFVTYHNKERHPGSQTRTDIGTIGADNSCWITGQTSVGVSIGL